jgi:hypothetical protein
MAPDQMLWELERLARRMGVEVRFEAFDPHATKSGGLCTLRGLPVVVIDAHAPTIEKVSILCDALSRFDVELLSIPPLLRARLQATR